MLIAPDGVRVGGADLNVRRLMYQSLIWLVVASYEARRLRAPFHAERLKREANALVDGVRRDVQLRRDFLGRKVLVDEQKTIELPARQLCEPLFDCPLPVVRIARSRRSVHEHILPS